MGKKKDLDFKKVKIKIGKSKPSNNVTKFNIKTAKIVIPGESKKKIEGKNRDDTYFSCNESDIADNMKFVQQLMLDAIAKKNEVIQKHRLDLTQSVWRTASRHSWVTPWDEIIEDYHRKLGSMEVFCWTVFQNAIHHKKLPVNASAVKAIDLYCRLFENTTALASLSKRVVTYIRLYMKSPDIGKKQLALDMTMSLAKYSPFSFWFVARWRAAVFGCQLLNQCLSSVGQLYGSFVDTEGFLALAAAVVASVVDGRRAGLMAVGEDASQLDDVRNPPFDDLYYRHCPDTALRQRSVVTDEFDKGWDDDDVEAHSSFVLNQFLTEFSSSIIDIGLKLLPVSIGDRSSMQKLCHVVQVLGRCCLRADNGNSRHWESFVRTLFEQFPFTPVASQNGSPSDSAMSVEEPLQEEVKSQGEQLSKKERKRQQLKISMEKRMEKLCQVAICRKRGGAPITGDIDSDTLKELTRLSDDLNYHAVALAHACVVSGKMQHGSATEDAVDGQCSPITVIRISSLVRQFMATRDWSRNEAVMKWLLLGRQMLRLSYERFSAQAAAISDVFLAFACDTFINSHCASKAKRIALAVYVDSCLRAIRVQHESIGYPLVDSEFWNVLVDLVVAENESGSALGLASAHPLRAPISMPQGGGEHYDITCVRAAYLLLQERYPGVSDLFRKTELTKKTVLRDCFNKLRPSVRQSRSTPPNDDWQKFYAYENSQRKQPAPAQFWDYFSYDLVARTSGDALDSLRPLCSSIDDFLSQ